MSIFKRILSFVLALVMVVEILPVYQAHAEECGTVLATEETVATEPTVQETVIETAAAPTTESVDETALPAEMEGAASEQETEEPATETETTKETETMPMEAHEILNTGSYTLPDWDESVESLTEQYLNYLFYGVKTEVAPFGIGGRERLSFGNQGMYDALKPIIADIAAGNRSSARIYLEFEGTAYEGYEMDLPTVIDALQNDCPFELYWYGGYCTWVNGTTSWTIYLYPADAYTYSNFDENNPLVNVTNLKKAASAADNAKSIVRQYAGYSDYDKIAAYADTICSLVEYDHYASDNDTYVFDVNPWGLVNVFDNDTSTNVVCEGYSEAFQYLCDLSTFQGDIECYSVNGANHKWNIVRINGISYLLDVTHIDVGSYADKTAKFLDGAPGNVEDGYYIQDFRYWYYDETIALFGRGPDSILRLSDRKYSVSSNPKPKNQMTQSEFVTALKNSGGSYRLTKCVMLTSDLEISGVDVTITSGSWINTKPGVDLVIQSDASIIVESGAEFCVDSNSKCAVWGDLSAQNGGKVIEDGTLYKLDSELVQYLSECCGSMTAAQICRQLQNIDQEALLVELREDFYCWWDYRKHLKLLESQIGGPATVVLEEDVAFFSEGNFKIQGANLNMPLDINQPIRVKVGYKDISGSDYLVGFSLELENVKDRKHSTVPLDITVTMPDGFSANGITLVKYRPDGSTEQVPLEKLGSQVQFVITELGEYALDYAKSGKLNSSISWTFETTTGTLTISGSGAIPNSVKWGNLDAKIRRAVIEEGITSLGSSLFSDLKMLEEVSLPVSLTRIENDVFYSSSLKSVIIPQNVTYIGDYAFGYMENLISVVFQGNAPEFYSKYTNKNNFYSVTATIYYPAGNSTWTESVRQNYGGTLTWVAGCTNGHTIVVTKGKDPTCTEPGISDSKICSACGAVLAVVSELEPLGHNMISDGEVPATCTAPGLQAGAHCSRCDYSEGRTEIPALGHTEVVDDYVAPTCTQTGLTKGSHCSRCNKTLVRQNVIDALGHNFVDAVCTVCGAGEVLEGISYDGLSWKIDEKGKLTITGEGDMYYTPWKNYADRIRTVEICSGSTRIYWDAFSGCTKLTKVTMADTVTEIGASAFEGCTSLTSIAIPTGVSAIEYCTFKDCISLTSISIPGSVTEIGWNAFEGCTSLCSMSLPQGLKVIESSVFEGCTALTSIEIPKTVKEIGGGAFSGCTNLLSANIPSGVEIVEYSTFDGCSSLSQITIPATVKEIESHAFRNCTSLTFVTVPQGVTTLGVGAFRGCTALYGVSLPKSLKTVEYDLFADCTSLCEVTIPAGLTELGDWMFSGCESLVKITIPNTVTTIGRAAFSNCSSLKEITLPASVTTLGSRAFINCGSLKSIKVSDSNAFFSADMYGVLYNKDKTVLVCIPGGTTGNYTIPEGVVVTEESAAANSTKLTGITFPSTLTTIEKYAFSNCSALMDVWFLNNAPVIVENAFEGTTLTARYQTGDGTWTPEILQNYGGSITWVASCVNDHAKVTQFGIPATCTEEGISDGEYCSLCGDILIRQEVIPALGHVEVIDKGFVPTCTETGLTEGKHCDRCGEVYVAQEVIPALGHEFAAQNGEIVCAVCGETVTIHIHQDYVALDIYENPQVQLYVDIAPANLTAYLSWSAEGNDGILQFDQNGLITALRAGTAYVVADLTVDGYTISSRCRVDATEHVQILGIQLSTDKVTTELYKDDFATFEILLDLPQNHPFTGDELVVTDEAAMSASGLENKSNLIESVQFKTISDLFELVLLDDRTVQIVPTQKAMESGKTLKSSYTDTVIVKIKGEEEPREEELKLTLTVKKTLPKPKAKINAFNSFYEGQSQEIVITGVDVTGIRANESKNTGKTVAIPNWLTLEEGKLTLNGNTPKSSDKAYLWVDVEGWRYPAELTLSVKHARKVPGIKLAATTVTVADRNASTEVELKLLCTNKNDTLKDLNITGITVPKDYSIENINVDDGTFTLKKEGGFTSDRITLTVAYGSATKDLTLNVKTQLVKLKLSSTKVSLNKELNDVATVAVNCLTMGYELVNPTLTYDSTILDVRYQDHKLVVGLKDAAIEGKTYPVTISAYQGAPVAKLNVAVLKKGSVVKSTIKATGTLDVIREGTAITVKPTYTNYLNVNVDTDAVLKIYSSKDSFKKAIAEVYAENGIFTIDSSVISNHVLKYKAQLETKLPGKAEPIKSNQISLSVKMGAAKLTTGSSGTTMFAKDRNDRALVWFEAADASLNDVKTIQIKDAKYKDVFEIIDYRDGSFAICFKDGKIHESIAKQLEKKSSISITLNLNVFIEGNETVDPAISKTAKANATQKVNLTILK